MKPRPEDLKIVYDKLSRGLHVRLRTGFPNLSMPGRIPHAMLRTWAYIKRSVNGQLLLFWLFMAGLVFGLAVLIASLAFERPCLSNTDRVTLFVGLLAGVVVCWQGQLIVQQLVLTAVIDLDKEWNSNAMLGKRSAAWIVENEAPNPDNMENVLEFLEKVSSLEKRRFVTRQLIWDTFGWYIGRYYFYCKNEIQRLRTYWTPKGDPTLYQDLERLYHILIAVEVEQRNLRRGPRTEQLTKEGIEEEYRQTRKMFIASEISDNEEND